MRHAVLALLVACGGPPPPPPAPIARPVEEAPAAPPGPVTCGEVGVILRGAVDDEQHAGPMKEAAIAQACLHGEWSAEVIACVGDRQAPRACLDLLTAEQRKAYDRRLIAWSDEYPDEELEDDIVDVPDALVFVACADGIGDVTTYAPPITGTGDDRQLSSELRNRGVLKLCEDWSIEVRRCFNDGEPTAMCRGQLAPDQERALAARLAELDALAARAAALRQRPAGFACKRVVAVHYGDRAWKGKLDTLKPAERRRLIAQSRAMMSRACVADGWTASLRACLAAAGGEVCFPAAGGVASWGYPARGLAFRTGIAECDAYGDALQALVQCPGVPRAAAQSMLDAYQQSAAALAATPPSERPARAAVCKRSDAAIRQSASALGCTI